MDRRRMRIGDWVCDAASNYELRAGVNEIQCSQLFVPIPLNESYLKSFRKEKVNDKVVYYTERDGNGVSLEDNGYSWRLSIRSTIGVLECEIHSVQDLQHFLSDFQVAIEV